MTDHNARQEGLTEWLRALADELHELDVAGDCATVGWVASRIDSRLAAHSADARNGEGVALTDAYSEAKNAYMALTNSVVFDGDRPRYIATKAMMDCFDAFFAAPTAPAPKCTRCEYIGKCDCEPAPGPAAQAYKPELTFEQWIESVPPLTWNGWGRREAAHAAWRWLEKRQLVLAARQQSTAPAECTCPSGNGSLRHPCPAHPADAASEADKRDAARWRELKLHTHETELKRGCTASEYGQANWLLNYATMDDLLDLYIERRRCSTIDAAIQRERQQGAGDA